MKLGNPAILSTAIGGIVLGASLANLTRHEPTYLEQRQALVEDSMTIVNSFYQNVDGDEALRFLQSRGTYFVEKNDKPFTFRSKQIPAEKKLKSLERLEENLEMLFPRTPDLEPIRSLEAEVRGGILSEKAYRGD